MRCIIHPISKWRRKTTPIPFESLSQKLPHGEVVLGGARAHVDEGGRDALLVSIDAVIPKVCTRTS
jgi:hypothetical protein